MEKQQQRMDAQQQIMSQQHKVVCPSRLGFIWAIACGSDIANLDDDRLIGSKVKMIWW